MTSTLYIVPLQNQGGNYNEVRKTYGLKKSTCLQHRGPLVALAQMSVRITDHSDFKAVTLRLSYYIILL